MNAKTVTHGNGGSATSASHPRSRSYPLLMIGALLLIGEAVIAPSCGSGKGGPEQAQKKAPEVRVAPAKKSAISRTLELTGSVEAYRLALPASPAEGPVVSTRVREGDRVKAGDTLLTIGRKTGADALVVSLREELRKEEENLRSTERLVADQALPGEQLDAARASYERARAQMAKAEESARDYSIIAPWNGVISRLKVKEGDFVPPRAPLLEMYDPTSLVIRAAVPERNAAEIKNGMKVAVLLDARPGAAIPSRVSRVYPYLDDRLRTRTIEIEAPRSIALLPGMFARLTLNLETIEDAVVVPIDALVATPAGPVVFVVDSTTAVRRRVQAGIEEAGCIQIISGVEAGERVVTAGNDKLKDGSPVRIAGDKKKSGAPSKEPGGGTSESQKKAGDGGK